METHGKIDYTELENCASCGQGLMHDGAPHFYRISLQSFIVNLRNVQQLHGMEVMMGAAAPLARVMAPSTTIAEAPVPADHLLICQGCALDPRRTSICQLLCVLEERANAKADQG